MAHLPSQAGACLKRHVFPLCPVCVLILTAFARESSGQSMPMSMSEPVCGPMMVAYEAPPADRQPVDLTGLSLEELYNLDIVQPNILGGHTHPAGQAMFGVEYMHT